MQSISQSIPVVRDAAAPYRELCTDCGVSRSSNPSMCGKACQFIRPDYPTQEQRVHGRGRKPADSNNTHNETFFGVHQAMYRARLKTPAAGAQWTGITTRIAELLLDHDRVDALLAIGADDNDRWKPKPLLITRSEEVARCRGMRMGYAPLLALLDQARDAGYRRLAVIGIPCQIYALRALQAEYGFDCLQVIGTPCSDNTTTERFHEFLALLDERPETINYLEFKANYHVELRFDDGARREIPYLKLPLSKLPANFFPTTCQTCVDYTNALSDITVGYMAGEGEQWVIVRNERGAQMLSLLEGEIELSTPGSSGRRHGSVAGFKKNVERAAGGLPLRSMPDWLRPLMSWLMPRIGPKGLEFARARLEMKAIETVLHLRRQHPRKIKHMVPEHVWQLAGRYGLSPQENELSVTNNKRRGDT